MKFLCKTPDLLQALLLVSRAISTQHALPILGNVLLRANGKQCTLSATDLELSIVTSFPASIESEGDVTVPAKAFLNFAQYNDDEEILLETVEGTQLKCISKHAKAVIAGEDAKEYPTISPMQKETMFTLEVDPLLRALHLVTFASAKTTLRPVLSGVYLRTDKGKLVFVATDSYRLSEYGMETESTGSPLACIIPAKVLEELRGILGGAKRDDEKANKKEKEEDKKAKSIVHISLSPQQIEFRVGETTLLSRLIEGKFPDYQQIIPSGAKTNVALPTKEFLTISKRLHYFAKEINNNLTFHLKTGEVHIATPQTQVGKDESMLAAEVQGGENKIALSSSYLLDFLGHINDDTVAMEITDSAHPALFRIPSEPLFLHLIMPLRIREE